MTSCSLNCHLLHSNLASSICVTSQSILRRQQLFTVARFHSYLGNGKNSIKLNSVVLTTTFPLLLHVKPRKFVKELPNKDVNTL